MKKAVFIDFYGTLVLEDGEIINRITEMIAETGTADNPREIKLFWWNEFRTLCENSYGDRFVLQREIERVSLTAALKRFNSPLDAGELSEQLFEYWEKPRAFPDSADFIKKCPLPVYIVSNIDTADIMKAVEYNGFETDGIFTSEDARSYKPRPELFEYALKMSGCRREDVVHIGDSRGSDIQGASAAGIDAVWLNRTGKQASDGMLTAGSLSEVIERRMIF